MIIPAMLLTVQQSPMAASPPSTPVDAKSPQPGAPEDIVVTGRSLADTERSLQECLARHCSPKEDIAASVAHAENQVVAGDYYGARKTLLAARGRDEQFAAQYPVEVGGLLRANARVASFVGQPDVSRINEIDSLDALKKGLAAGDERVLAQRLEVGDAFAKQGGLQAAVDIYRKTAREAHDKHLPLVEGGAMLREVALYSSVASVIHSYEGLAEAARNRLLKTTDPALQPFRDAVGDVVKRLSASKAGGAAPVIPADASTQVPQLLYQPAWEPNALRGASVSGRFGDGSFVQWADVAFRITPAGSVDDVEVLQHSTPFDDKWLDVAKAALAKRRYTGYVAGTAPPGIDRTERYSFVYDVVPDKGTRIPGRSGTGRIEVLDLTPPPPNK